MLRLELWLRFVVKFDVGSEFGLVLGLAVE